MTTNACFECGEFFKSREEAHLLISAAGLSGHVTSCHVCATCHDEARKTGAPGPNVTAAGYRSANAERNRRDTTPLRNFGWGRNGGR
jgi:hypothetical protein